MKVTVEAINTPTIFQFGNSAPELRIYALESFITADQQFIPKGRPNNKKDWYLPIPCSITGGNIIMIPTFEIDSTVDTAPQYRNNARYTARFFTSKGRPAGVFPGELSSFRVPAEEDLTWGAIDLFNRSFHPYHPLPNAYWTVDQVQAAISAAVANVRTYHLGGLRLATGTGTMTNGVATVLSSVVASDSRINPSWMTPDNPQHGNLSVPSAQIVPGVSFNIVSTDQLDSGVVGWDMWYA